MESENDITNHLFIKNIISDLKDRQNLLGFHFGEQIVHGTFSAFDVVLDGMKIVLDRRFDHKLNEKVLIDFVYKKDYYKFESVVSKAIGSSVYVNFPTLLVRHPNRESKRLQVFDKKIPIRIHFIGAVRRKALKKEPRLENAELEKIYAEIQQEVPELATLVQYILTYMRRFGDKFDVKLGKLSKLFYPAEVIFQNRKTPFFMPDTAKEASFSKADPEIGYVSQFIDFAQVEEENTGKNAASLTTFWMEEYKSRAVTSEVYIPIRIMGNVIGMLYCATTPEFGSKLGINDVFQMMALGDALAEAVIKRNINSKNDKEVYHVQLFDISEGGMQFVVNDPIFSKILQVASEIMVSINFFDKWIRTYGTVVRAIPKEGENDGVFSIKFHQDEISSSDRIYLKRVINTFERQQN